MQLNCTYNLGGGGITPPSYTISEEINTKSACIDYFTCTFDKIEYIYKNGRISISKESSDDIKKLFEILTADKAWYEYDKDYGRNNYKEAIVIGEFIRIQFYGPKNGKGNRTTMIEFTGNSCREFLGRGGKWLHLVDLMIRWDAKCTRFDIAIDDKSGVVCNIYDLWKNYISKYNFTGPFHQVYPQMPMNTKLKTYKGFGIYFGTRGRNQLLIYDKKLERESAGKSVFEKCWYRYEMRFTGGKATTIMRKFLTTSLKSQNAFNSFASNCLLNYLDVKIPDPYDSNQQRWETAPFWTEFLGIIKKMRIVNEYKPEITIEKKEKWVERSVDMTLAKLYITDKDFLIKRMQAIGTKLTEMQDKDVSEINKYLIKNGEKEITKDDLIKFSENILISEDESIEDNPNVDISEDDLPF